MLKIKISPKEYFGLYLVMNCVENANEEKYKLGYSVEAPPKLARQADAECFELTLSELCDIGAGEEDPDTAKKAPTLVKFVQTYVFKG